MIEQGKPHCKPGETCYHVYYCLCLMLSLGFVLYPIWVNLNVSIFQVYNITRADEYISRI